MVGEVHQDSWPQGFHWWNRLPNGVELDLLREQFQHGQAITDGPRRRTPPGPAAAQVEGVLSPA